MMEQTNRGTVIDIDIGGTFTDCFVRRSTGDSTAVKTPTTGFRLAVGFKQGLEETGVRFLSVHGNGDGIWVASRFPSHCIKLLSGIL